MNKQFSIKPSLPLSKTNEQLTNKFKHQTFVKYRHEEEIYLRIFQCQVVNKNSSRAFAKTIQINY